MGRFAILLPEILSPKVARARPTAALSGALVITGAAGLASVTQPWVAPSSLAWSQLLAASVFIICGYVFSVMTMRIGAIAAVTPFRYTSLIWALVLGYALFGDWPDPLTLIGAAIVVTMGLFTLIRERQLAQNQGRHVPAPPA